MRTIAIILLFLPVGMLAQNKKTGKTGWRSITGAGFVAGESGVKPVFQLSGGIKYNRYFTGIGLGYDSYQFDAFSLFADWRMSFGKKQLLFAYATPGYAIPEKYKSHGEDFRKDRMKGGFYMDAGFGYRIPISILHRLSFSAGYIRKSVSHKIKYIYPCGTPCVEIPPTIYVNRFKYGLITTRLSWELGK